MIRILIAEDIPLLRNGMKTILEQDKEMKVVAAAGNGREAVELCKAHRPDIVLMDIRMPDMDGIDATRIIKENHLASKVLILTTFYEPSEIERALDYGVDGYILKDIDHGELLSVIRSTMNGLNVLHPNVFKSIRSKENPAHPAAKYEEKASDESVHLTNREREILQLLIQGKKNKEIAEILFVTEGTVKNMTSKILKKANLEDRTQLAIYAVKNNLV